MANSELKLDLIQKIINSNNIDLLMKIEELLIISTVKSFEVNEPTATYKKTEKVLILNESQHARIDIALKEVENGDYLTEEEDKMEMEKWFKEEERLFGQ
jgi:hypothetical protein